MTPALVLTEGLAATPVPLHSEPGTALLSVDAGNDLRQQGTVTGRVTTTGTLEPLPGRALGIDPQFDRALERGLDCGR